VKKIEYNADWTIVEKFGFEKGFLLRLKKFI